MLEHKAGPLILSVTALAIIGTFFVPPIAQSLSYHLFADSRYCCGTPNAADVWSNLPFLLVGLWASLKIMRSSLPISFTSPLERWSWFAFAVGVLLVGPGSAYYHWSPDNYTLVWDRLPMTIAFMGLVTALLSERLGFKSFSFLVCFILIGLCSVIYWHWTEQKGVGDLRPYALVQFLPMLILPLVLYFYKGRYTHTYMLGIGFGWYVAAKVLEHFDVFIFNALHKTISGHTLKHLAAAVGAYTILRYVFVRQKVH